jgi:hypothetical protein
MFLYREHIFIPSHNYLWKGYSINFYKQLKYLLENILRQLSYHIWYSVWNGSELPPFDLAIEN